MHNQQSSNTDMSIFYSKNETAHIIRDIVMSILLEQYTCKRTSWESIVYEIYFM